VEKYKFCICIIDILSNISISVKQKTIKSRFLHELYINLTLNNIDYSYTGFTFAECTKTEGADMLHIF